MFRPVADEGERLRVELAREDDDRYEDDAAVNVGDSGGNSCEAVREVGSDDGDGNEVVGVEARSRFANP